MRFVLCSRDLDVLRAQRIIRFLSQLPTNQRGRKIRSRGEVLPQWEQLVLDDKEPTQCSHGWSDQLKLSSDAFGTETEETNEHSTSRICYSLSLVGYSGLDMGYYDRVSYSTYILTVSYIAPSTPLSHDSTLPRARRVLDKQLSQQTNNETMRQTNTR